MISKFIIAFILFSIILIAFIAWQLYAYKAPQPKYHLIKSSDKIEIREYPELILAEVKVSGERYASINEGFRILANYIFGNNQRHIKIAMTAPVEQEQTQDGWVVKFIMPAEFNMSTLPPPNNQSITLTPVKSKQYIVIRFSGSNTDENLESHKLILLNYIKSNQIKTVGSPIFAFYNPPWILPFLRRNEILIELQKL